MHRIDGCAVNLRGRSRMQGGHVKSFRGWWTGERKAPSREYSARALEGDGQEVTFANATSSPMSTNPQLTQLLTPAQTLSVFRRPSRLVDADG